MPDIVPEHALLALADVHERLAEDSVVGLAANIEAEARQCPSPRILALKPSCQAFVVGQTYL